MPSTPRDLIPEEFAGNEWLVEDLYERYRKDRDSVDRDWWPVFEAMDRAASSGSDGAAAEAHWRKHLDTARALLLQGLETVKVRDVMG